ncbi:DMT family transporter [Fimbriimonas ginsengisoli]|uniref:Putative membrane protein n=1 Tax=Fimbriimonas ginsengisoli Gsoil 348 TaxID=661478 RepID=A0A068NPG1_FIMGI|nr:DMT family transporter [Fimbriimonas ginsengisoli]AIE85262.1 putative membrane protein [Fimbriimonas ginsengisoli Gsoil 348]
MLYPLVLIGGVLAVGAGALFVRIGLEAGMTPLQLSLWRLTLASLLLGIWAVFYQPDSPGLNAKDRARLTLAGICLAFHFVTWMTSLEYISVARSTLLVSITPVFAGILGLFVPAMRPTKSFWIGLAIAAFGVVLVTKPATHGPMGHGSFWVGDGMAIAGALLILPYLLLSQRVQEEHGTARTVTWIYSSAAVCLWIVALSVGQQTVPSNPSMWLAVGGMALFPQLVGHTVFNWSLRHFTAGQVASATLLEPVFAAILAWIFLAERIDAPSALGGAILLAGVLVTLKKPHREVC